MKRVLFVSIAFPPKKDPECIQTARYFHYLSKTDKFYLDVLTSKSPTLFMPEDPTLNKYNCGWDHKYELKILENKYLSFIQRNLWESPLILPDTKAHFHRQWKKAVSMINNPPDIIYSRSYPLSSSVAAYKLVKYFKVPWVLHLSDPWEDSPLHQYSPKGKSYHKIWENLCFNQANAICLTSQKSIEFYSKKYPKLANKFQLFPNVFDPSEIKRNRYQIRDKLRIVYTGGLAGTRSPNTFLEGLQQFNKVSGMSNLLEVIFAGPCDRKMQAVIKKFNLSNFKYVGSLSLEESIKLQRTADILLIIDSHIHSEELSMYFPSKILEYLIAQRRIVSLTTKNSSTAHIMSQLGFHSIDLEDVDEIANHLGFLADKLVSKSYSYFQIENVPEEFSASYNANRLAELLNNV